MLLGVPLHLLQQRRNAVSGGPFGILPSRPARLSIDPPAIGGAPFLSQTEDVGLVESNREPEFRIWRPFQLILEHLWVWG